MNKMREIMKKGMAILLVMVMLIVVAPTVKTEAATKVKLNKTKTVMYLASTQTIRISGTSIKRIATGNSKIATVRKTGSKTMEVRAKKAGSTVVGIRGTNGKLYTCKVTVLSKKAPRISVARQVALYKAKSDDYKFGRHFEAAYKMIDINGDGVYELVMSDSDGAQVLTINKKNQVVRIDGLVYLDGNDDYIYRTSSGKFVVRGKGSQSVGYVPPDLIIEYNSRTGEFDQVHKLRYEVKVKWDDPLAALTKEKEHYKISKIMNYYVDNVKYSSYNKAITKFESYYKGETTKKILDQPSKYYTTIDEAYRHRVYRVQ